MRQLCLAIISLSLTIAAGAATLEGINLPDQIKVADKDLVLNGLGLRQASFLGVKMKVYVGGLYVEKKTTSADEIFKMKSPKKVVMQFMRDVGKSRMIDAWTTGIEKNCTVDCVEQKKMGDEMMAALRDIEKGETLTITMADKVTLEIIGNDPRSKSVGNAAFAETMLKIYIGPNAGNPDLKAGLLGTK